MSKTAGFAENFPRIGLIPNLNYIFKFFLLAFLAYLKSKSRHVFVHLPFWFQEFQKIQS